MSRAAFAAAAFAAASLGAAPAAAAQLNVAVFPPAPQLGEAHFATGQMTDDAGNPLPGRRISLEVRPFPFTGDFRPLDHATTDAKGRFRFRGIELDRNYDIRVRAFDGTTSGIARAFTYPATTLGFRSLRHGRLVRLTQRYRVPRDVALTARTLFYVGRASASSAPVRARAKTVRVRRGRYRSTATIALPRSWHGRFHYASCFRYSRGSGMGDPAAGCPRRYRF